jgi:uncharacterized protein (DUF952 family)
MQGKKCAFSRAGPRDRRRRFVFEASGESRDLTGDHNGQNAMSALLFKICDRAAWDEAERAGAFMGAGADLRDGYIHSSTADQVVETAARHFAERDDLVIVAVEADHLGAALVWEPSRGGALFPHLYGPLPLTAVLWVKPLPRGGDGRHHFPLLGR